MTWRATRSRPTRSTFDTDLMRLAAGGALLPPEEDRLTMPPTALGEDAP